MTFHAAPNPSNQVCGGIQATNLTINVQVRNDGCDIGAGTASNDNGTYYNPSYSMAKPAYLPTGETTTGVGWGSGAYQTVQQFRQTLQGSASLPFDGRQLGESAGATKADSCFYSGAASRGYAQFGVTGGWWIVGRYAKPPYYTYSNTWIDDYVGMTTDLVALYQSSRSPCSAYALQLMNICTNGQGCTYTQNYTSDYITYSVSTASVTAGRASDLQSRVWP
jgi:hypothetical protein